MSPLAPFVPNATIERGMRLEPIIARDSVGLRTLDGLRDVLIGDAPRQAIAYCSNRTTSVKPSSTSSSG